MTKIQNNARKSAGTQGRGGRMVKGDNGAASVAPEGNGAEQTVEQTEELKDAIQATADAGKEAIDVIMGQPAEDTPVPEPEVEQPVVTEPETPTEEPVVQPDIIADPAEETGQDGEQVEAEQQPEAEVVVDPFADLPVIEFGDAERKHSYVDLSDVEGNEPFKYAEVHKAAVAGRMPVKPNWKHAGDMIAGHRSPANPFKESSCYGTIDKFVRMNGRAGISAVELVGLVRRAQIGNKRSKYCGALPPIGWAEGWIDTYISKGYGKVMAAKAPPVTAMQVAAEVKANEVADTKATDTSGEQSKAA